MSYRGLQLKCRDLRLNASQCKLVQSSEALSGYINQTRTLAIGDHPSYNTFERRGLDITDFGEIDYFDIRDDLEYDNVHTFRMDFMSIDLNALRKRKYDHIIFIGIPEHMIPLQAAFKRFKQIMQPHTNIITNLQIGGGLMWTQDSVR